MSRRPGSRGVGRTLAALVLRAPSVLAPFLGAPAAVAAEGAGEGVAQVPVRIVAEKLVVLCDVSTSERRIPVSLFVEFDTACGLRLHDQAARPLGAETDDGRPRPITLHLPGREIVVPARERGPEEEYERFTKYHSEELAENAVVGTIGARILAAHHVVLDLANDSMILSPPADPGAPPPEPASAATEAADGEAVEVPLTLVNDLAWLPVRDAAGDPAALALATSRFDTVLDSAFCARRGRPAGDVGRLSVAGFDLSRYVAFRPEVVAQVHPDGVAGVVGLNLLRHFRVEIDRVRRRAILTETAPPAFPEADLAFFRARADGTAGALAAYLDGHGGSRLAGEAARLLLDRLVDEGAPPEELTRALRWFVESHAEDRRATAAHDLMVELAEAGETEALVPLGEIGVESGRDDRDPNAVHRIHARLGHLLLEQGDDERAWKHLLSAAFGLPEDGPVNLDLGRLYERQGRDRRAFSRYVQAVISPESGAEALAALQRVQARLGGEGRMSVDEIERRIAGKVLSFGTASKYRPADDAPGRVALVELFTNAHADRTLAGELAFEGLAAHFSREHVALLSYHLPAPDLDPLVNDLARARASQLGLGRLEFRVDGSGTAPAQATKDRREDLYEFARGLVGEALSTPPEVELALSARLDGDRVRGELVVTGEQRWGRVVHLVLAEKAVLFPGRNEVPIHRMVARASLAGEDGGVPFRPVDRRMALPFDVTLAEVAAQNAAALDRLVAEGKEDPVRMSIDVDPEQVTLVAFVHDVRSNRVLQAVQVDPAPAEEGP